MKMYAARVLTTVKTRREGTVTFSARLGEGTGLEALFVFPPDGPPRFLLAADNFPGAILFHPGETQDQISGNWLLGVAYQGVMFMFDFNKEVILASPIPTEKGKEND